MDCKTFSKYLNQICGINADNTVLVGVSGGPDSVCMLDLLQKIEIRVIVANYNHHLRPESDNDSEFVKDLAIERKLEFTLGEGDVRGYAYRNHLPIEEAARILRYEFLFNQARNLHMTVVAVGHNADDQVETIWMHLLRGCGLNGLKGMAARSLTEFNHEIPLIRPLLSFWRDDVLAYCAKEKLRYILDPSNKSEEYFRNRVRLLQIPLLEKDNPGFKRHLFHLGQIILGDIEVLDSIADQAYHKSLLIEKNDTISLSKDILKNHPISFQRRIIKAGLQKLMLQKGEINFDHIQRIIDFIYLSNRSKHIELPGNIQVFLEKDQIILTKSKNNNQDFTVPQLADVEELMLSLPGRVKINNQWILAGEILPNQNPTFANRKTELNFTVYIDPARITLPLVVRRQKPGDRFQPLGLNSHNQKVSDFWINKKVPIRARKNWPLIFSGGQLIWIPGFQPAELCKITDETNQIVKLTMKKIV